MPFTLLPHLKAFIRFIFPDAIAMEVAPSGNDAGDISSFAKLETTFWYRGQMTSMTFAPSRQRDAPEGRVGFTGDGQYAKQQLSVAGRYTADNIEMNYTWFHPGKISAHGSYRADQNAIDAPDLEAFTWWKRRLARARGSAQSTIPRRLKSSRTRPASDPCRGR